MDSWLESLAEYEFEVKYRHGKDKKAANFLSIAVDDPNRGDDDGEDLACIVAEESL